MALFLQKRFSILLAGALIALCGACNQYYVAVNNFQLARFRPSIIPMNSAIDLVYDLILDSDKTENRDAPLPISSFDTYFYLEGERAAESQMPPNVKSITLGQPVQMQGQIVLKDVAGLAPKLPVILKKEEWDIGLRGKMGIKTLSLDFVKVPVVYSRTIPNPTKNEQFRNQMPPALKGILDGL